MNIHEIDYEDLLAKMRQIIDSNKVIKNIDDRSIKVSNDIKELFDNHDIKHELVYKVLTILVRLDKKLVRGLNGTRYMYAYDKL